MRSTTCATLATAPPPRPDLTDLVEVADRPWTVRIGGRAMIVRRSTARDLAAVAHMHSRCSARSLLDRYRAGGRPPAVAALDRSLRQRHTYVAVTAAGEVTATATLGSDPVHRWACAEAGVLVEDAWQRRGLGCALMSHLAGVAKVAGYSELITYPGTAVAAAQRLMVEVGRTRVVPDVNLHLHTYLPRSATLGLGSVRQQLAG